MLKIPSIILLSTFSTFVFCETCVKYDFENNFESAFSNASPACQQFATWKIEDYSNIFIRKPNFESTKFISPATVETNNELQLLNNCIRSFGFQMSAGGTVEIMFYMEAKSQRDLLFVTVSKIVTEGNEVDVGFGRYSMTNSDYKSGWNILKIDIGGNGEQFDGYIHFYGTVTEDSILLIDSFRYIEPNGDTGNCELELINETETEGPTTVADSDIAVNDEHCTTYDFETNFESLFNNHTSLCQGSLFWELQSYENSDISTPHANSNSFISPANMASDASWQTFSSCVSSFKFPMTESGSLEIKLYMEVNSPIDIFFVSVQQISSGGNDVTLGTETYSMFHADYTPGWNILKVNVQSTAEQFNGYVSFLGVLSSGSALLVDSFRYVSDRINEENCIVYRDAETTTITTVTEDPTTETPTTTDDPTTLEPTTEIPTTPISTTEISSTITTIEPTTDTPTTDNPTTITSTDTSTTDDPTTIDQTTEILSTITTAKPTTDTPTTDNPTTITPTTEILSTITTTEPTTDTPTTDNPTTIDPTTDISSTMTTVEPTTDTPTTDNPTTITPTTEILSTITTVEPTTDSPTTDNPTTEVLPTTPTINPTTSAPINKGECVTYDFENNFNLKFSNDSLFCSGFPSWEIENYDNIDIEKPHTQSNNFITPTIVSTDNSWQTYSSCVTSFTLSMEVGGTIEVKFYMEAKTQSDSLLVAVSRSAVNGFELIINLGSYSILDPNYTDGWNTLRIKIIDAIDEFDGHLLFLGTISEGAVLVVDSFRYIGPTMDEESCVVYTEVETTAPIPTTTSVPPVEDDICVIYDFEDNFDSLFSNENYLCVGLTSWQLGNYSSIDITGVDPNSKSFMNPDKDLSCITSFPFAMSPGGTVEVNVYMDPTSDLDYITVLAKILIPNGVDTVAGLNMYHPSSANFVRGWNVLQIKIASLTDFNGYILFLGAETEGATVLVDSFRYIPPSVSVNDESCHIYESGTIS